jgi:uncharacterized repeat protein (TIGR01451 family)
MPPAFSHRRFTSRFAALRTLLAGILGVSAAGAANIIHEFYVPMPEAQERTAFVAIEPASGIVGQTMESVISIVVTGTGSVIHYDEWEDGYEVDLNNPAQPTTKIWGDGNNANGIPPGYANDPAGLASGAVINLRNLVPLPRNPATVLYDGRDRFGGTKALVVTRTGWAVNPGSVLAGSVEVTATMDYGTQYVSPVGQDVSANSMFEYVGLMVMARENGTPVSVDVNGPAPGGNTSFSLNRGESYLVNGGVLKGATVTANKPVQVQLITGDIGARYETDWFTLYPVDQWTGTYYSPVGTAADGDPTYGFFYNPHASSLTINVVHNLGTGSFNVPANGVVQYQMPQNSGARFASASGATYFGVVMVGSNPSANNVHDWGFTLVPSDSLTTEAVAGWGPGSSDLSQNGSPVWVTPVAATRLYVDYDGDRDGSLTDPGGSKYDVHYDMNALETRRLFDPDKDQSAMRVYTLDGVQITAAWGQDPATAGPGNPFLDVGTTVLPFPVPTLKKTFASVVDTAPAGLSIGDTIEYSIEVDNRGLLPLGNLLVLDPLNPALTYVAGSTTRDGVTITDDGTGTAFPLDESGYVVPIIMRGGSTFFTYRCVINSAGSIANTASNANYNLVSTVNVVVPPPAGATACGAQFTDAAGVVQAVYTAGASIYATLTDPDANNNTSAVESFQIVVNNTTSGDAEFVTLVETGANTGIFRNTTGLATSTTTGTSQMDGTLLVAPGNSLSFTYTDPEFSDSCTGNALIAVPTQNKFLYLSDPSQALDRVDPVAAADGSTASTASLAMSTSTIAVDNVSTGSGTNPFSSVTFSHTTGSGSNRFMLVGISYEDDNTAGLAVSGVTYAGQALTFVGRQTSPQEVVCEIWRLVNPPSGAANVVVSVAGSGTGDGLYAGAITYTGVHQTTPLGTLATASNTSTTASATVSSAANELVFGVLALDDGRTATNAGGQTERWNGRTDSGADGVRAAAATKTGAASTALSWTVESDAWSVCAVPIKPAQVPATTTFTQTPAFASAFTVPVGAVPAVTAYYNVTSGSMPGSPAITATLKKNAATVATSSSASASGGLLTFTFPALAGAANFTAGDVFALDITTAQSGLAFTVDFDSSTKPSKITLPTTTVIHVDSLGVYDAPYPGGSLITGPAGGSTVYVRSTASDPFGAYDITSMGLSIDGPGAASDLSTTLNAGNVVASNAGTKTYEYAWTVGATEGTYNVVVTANEGSEGIQATRATSVNVTFLDLGTPSVTEFTTGSNGPHTLTYAGNEQVFVRIIDLDQNMNPAVAETIPAVITSLAGDSELVALDETGIDTGVFVGGIPASTSAPNTFNDGTLHAVLGDLLTVNYVDPNDSTDTGSDTATIPNSAPSISVTKTLVTPADGLAVVGELLQYTVQVTNTGNTTLGTVALSDTFPAANLVFVSASVAPTTSGAGSLTWANVGPLTQGQSTTLTLNFTALASAAPAVNSATADAGGGVTDADNANVTITDPSLSLTKSLLTPNPGPASIGDLVTFRIALQNTGDTAIATLPLEDTFSGADFEYVSATVAPDATGAGSLLWLDLTGAGTLAPAASITVDVTLRAKGAATPANNLAEANYTVDVNGDDVPPVSSTASITLVAASISGHVYDDVDQSVSFNSGDSVLANVTVSLHTDPNGDGNPSDGVLVAITTTAADGSYEFLNLAAGNYVVVESQPPGYSSSGDTAGANDNRIPVVVSTLASHTDNNFFDFLTPAVNYASIEGTVWNDANASTTVNGGETGIANVAVQLVEDINANGSADPGESVVQATLTAADGSYSFIGLNAGNYVVIESDLFGWMSTADAAAPNNNLIPVVLSAGQNVTGRDFLDVLTGTTGGKVFHDVNGSGTFDAGDVALANIDVIVTSSLAAAQTLVTDVNGNWSATVPPGSTSIDVQQGDPQFAAVFTLGHTQTAGTDPNTITAVSGVNTPGGDDGFRQIGTISGHLYLDTNGDGMQGVGEPDLPFVSLLITDSAGATQTVLTDAGGNWSATVPPGSTSADVQESDPDLPAGSVRTEGTDPTIVTAVANTDTSAGIDGYFQPGSISGSVHDDIDNDDHGDIPLSGVTLTLKDNSGNDIDSNPSLPGVQPTTTTTNINGDYNFADLPPGTYRVVETDPPGYVSVTINTLLPVIVTEGVTTFGVNFIDEQAATIGNRVWHDADNDGLDNNGEPGLDGVTLELLTSAGLSIDTDDITPGIQPTLTTTAGGGAYSFVNVPPGTYRLRIATPPASYPLSSTTTDTADNGQDGDDNGSQTTPTAATLSPLISVAPGEVENTVDFGFTALTGSLAISGQVRDDYDEDGNFSDNDQPVPLVTVRLYADSNGNGVFNPGIDTLIATTTTNSFGNYSFSGLPDGIYFVQEVDPAGSSSTADTQGSNDNIIPVTLSGSSSTGNDFLDAVDPSGYAYDVVTGQIIGGGSIAVSGPGAVTILLDGSTGQYSFLTDGTPGSYTLTYTPPLGYIIDPARPVAGPSLDPTGGPDPYVLGSDENPSNPGYLTSSTAVGNPYYLTFDLAAGDPFVVQNNIPLRLQVPRRYIYWKVITPGGGPTPGSNGDGDCYTDLVEYALNLNPSSGVQTTPAFRGVRNTLTGKLDVSFERVAGSVQDVAYTLVGIRSLADSPAGWTALSLVPAVTNNGNGTETVTYADVESDPYFSGFSQGFVRLKLDLDENLDTLTDATASTPAFGWTRRTFGTECVMTGHPYLKDKIFCGAIDAVSGSTLDVTTSAGGVSIVAQFLPGRDYFVEIYSGDHAGHRFEIDEAASTATSIVLDAANALNTLTTIPATLTGDKAVVREHHTLNDLFPSTQFVATGSATTADRIMFYDRGTSGFQIYWLYTSGGPSKWVVSGNATLDDMGGRVVDPCEGWFTHPKGLSQELVWHGMVRANPFACPLAAGPNFIGSGYPMDQSPAMRGMTTANGFRGSRNPTQADELLFWKGYSSTQAMAYFNHYLLSHGALQQWTELGNASLLNENNLLMFKATAGSIYKMRGPLPAYVMPLPWTP